MLPFAKYLILSQHRPHCPSSLLQAFTDPWLAVTLSHTTLNYGQFQYKQRWSNQSPVLSLPFPLLQWTYFPPPYSIIPMSVCSVAQLCLTLCIPMDVALQTLLSMEFSRKEYWSGLPFPVPQDLLNPVPPKKPSHFHGHIPRLYSFQ